jgi:hypothetical protein
MTKSGEGKECAASLDPKDILAFLRERGINTLYHANTVQTATLFLTEGGLLSRGAVERRGLVQTRQWTDDRDKRVGVWDDAFLDIIDIHHQLRRRNKYGPVLFELDPDFIIELGEGEIRVTKRNPANWKAAQPIAERYCMSVAELAERSAEGALWNYSVTITSPANPVLFGSSLRGIILDDPGEAPPACGAYAQALETLEASVPPGRIGLPIVVRHERGACCDCLDEYSQMGEEEIAELFKLVTSPIGAAR